MKFLQILIVSLTTLFFITGCAPKDVPTPFNEEFTNPILKNNLKKTNKFSINISPNNDIYELYANNLVLQRIPIKIEEKTNTLVLREFLNQYFQNVNINNEKTDINIKTTIKKFSFSVAMAAVLKDVDVEIHIVVEKDGKEIINKIYTGNSKEISELVDNSVQFSMRLTFEHILQQENEDYHRALVWIYENKFKPDLLEALKNNM